MRFWDAFPGPNAGYVLEQYERYLRDPQSVDASTRAIFERWSPPLEQSNGHAPATAVDAQKIIGGVHYAQAIRDYGHLAAQLDPLGARPPGDPAMNPAAHGLTQDDLAELPPDLIDGPIAGTVQNALEATEALRQIYAATTGYDFEQVRLPEERDWLRHAVETRQYYPPKDPIDPVSLLKRLTEVEAFEHFIHRVFPGKHRFSIEGLDMMIPILDEIIGSAAESGVFNILIGMAHRGRLNALAHILNKPYAQILAEFKDPIRQSKFREDLGWTGDVKYHMGARRALASGDTVNMMIAMPPNPSHLEFINPIVEGMARAVGTKVNQRGAPQFDPRNTVQILIHGDAAFPGQGVVAETLNLSRTPGYFTGGTMHIIANNQLGYTTEPLDSRSTLYASDLAKGFKIPIIHVNADDPEACIAATRLAFAYLQLFEKDFVIDLIGYRRYGHNEGDEPAFTQPVLYQKIEQHPTVRALWGKTLVERGILQPNEPDDILRQQMEKLQGIYEALDPEKDLIDPIPTPPTPGTARRVTTRVPLERLRTLNRSLLNFPEGFNIHPKLQRVIKRRVDGLDRPDEPTIDWSNAEDLALASILEDGIAVRMAGQDVERGTFSQRHAVFHDYQTGEEFLPLQALPQAKAAYEIHNSPLSEQGVLGFEYGYNVQAPDRLVLWEAQYGDFDNGAQVIIDEFIVSARAKWGQTPSLALLLPHGYEGAGPDHSSARLERFLEMAAETNMRVANPTTAAQYFHLLRRQALLLKSDPLPLIVMTPKSLLRNPLVNSPLQDLAEGRWMPVIDDEKAQENRDAVRRLLLCSGKVYVDLVNSEPRKTRNDISIVRVEQLYPFPVDDIQQILKSYPNVEQVVWVQEEPENMGAWEFARPYLINLVYNKGIRLGHIARPRNSSPAEGSAAWHAVGQNLLIEQAFSQETDQNKVIVQSEPVTD